MNFNFSVIRILFQTSLVILLVSGCESSPHRPSRQFSILTQDLEMTNPAWHRCFFRIVWPEDTDVQFEIDLLLAHQVIGPVLKQYGDSLYRWRFHRRAVRDTTGHQFSFIFYSGSGVAVEIIDKINHSELKERLLEMNVLDYSGCTLPDEDMQKLISDTSDSIWPESIQRHWPIYIMGVSMTWLALIDDVTLTSVTEDMDIKKMIDVYADAEEEVNEMWTEYGQHAFLHHLNAVFGYESLLIRY